MQCQYQSIPRAIQLLSPVSKEYVFFFFNLHNLTFDYCYLIAEAAEHEIVGWHHRFSGHELGHTQGDSEGQGRPGVLRSMGLQRVRHDLATEQHCYLN